MQKVSLRPMQGSRHVEPSDSRRSSKEPKISKDDCEEEEEEEEGEGEERIGEVHGNHRTQPDYNSRQDRTAGKTDNFWHRAVELKS